MRIIRFKKKQSQSPILAAVTEQDKVYTLPYKSLLEIVEVAKNKNVKAIELINEILLRAYR